MSEPLIELECFEPAGAKLEFGREDLLGHSLALGGSGSGKTSRFVLPMVRELIHSRERIGLVILDTKADGQMPASVKDALADAGREEDLIVIDGSGAHTLDVFGDRTHFGLDEVDALTSLLGSLIPRDMKTRKLRSFRSEAGRPSGKKPPICTTASSSTALASANASTTPMNCSDPSVRPF